MTARPIHANCVALDGRAILLMGNSGSGKSDLSLRLIDRGWSLVADDYVCLIPSGGKLLAKPPPNIAGRIEVRNVGLVELPYLSDSRSEEHTSELQSLMRISYAVFCLKK